MNEQQTNLRRVRTAIAKYVTDFIDEHEGRTFSNAELHNYVAERHRIAPGSADRVMRSLKSKGTVTYELRDRAKSLYYVPMVGQRSLF